MVEGWVRSSSVKNAHLVYALQTSLLSKSLYCTVIIQKDFWLRTYLLGSLPYGEKVFDPNPIAFTFSLISVLKANDYTQHHFMRTLNKFRTD
jgi:hypothetical protein